MSNSIAHLPQDAQELLRQRASTRARRTEAELMWVRKQPFLMAKGYQLRQRYDPNWKPSWNGKDINPASCEDYAQPPKAHRHIVDAMDTLTGQLVCIKQVQTASQELEILKKFQGLAGDPSNHCVPLLKTFEDNEDDGVSYIVMPFLRRVDEPMFETIRGVLDFVTQMLQGLSFMHENNVAHYNCEYRSLMMDARAMFPQGFHPARVDWDPTLSQKAVSLPRDATRIKYYFVDFALSVNVAPPIHKNKFVTGTVGGGGRAPELALNGLYDVFKVDIYTLGNALKTVLYKNYAGMGFLLPLIDQMTAHDPAARPSAAEAESFWARYKRTLTLNESTKVQPLN